MDPSDGSAPPESGSAVPSKTAGIVQYSRRRQQSSLLKPQPPPITSVFSRKRTKPTSVPESTIKKRTRDLLDMSECHSCGFRIDLSSGKDRLETLYSEWRVVLLCRKCISRVESSAICSYCFDEVSEGLRCSDCSRRIHKSCFFDYKSTPPWSYSCSSSQFSVCIDCWLPKPLARSRPLKLKGRAEKAREVVCALRCNKVVEAGPIAKPLRNVKEGVISSRGSNAEGSHKSCDKEENALPVSNSFGAKSNTVVDDAELAFRLHRSMNSSPRISKKLCSDKVSIMVYNRRMTKPIDNTMVRGSESGTARNSGSTEVGVGEGSRDNLDKSSSENLMTASLDSLVNLHIAEAITLVDQGSGKEDCACLVKCNEEEEKLNIPMKKGGESSLNGMGTESQTCSKYDDSVKPMDVGNIQKNDQMNVITYCKKRFGSEKDGRCKNLYERIHHYNMLPPL